MTEPKRKSAFIWNMLGSGMNAAMTMVLTVVTAQIIDADASGLVSLAFGLAFIFGCIATFEVRVYQSTDLNGRFSFGDYLGMRCLSCLTSIVLCIVAIKLMNYSGQKAQIIFLICLFKICEALSDVCQGLFQARDHLENAGQSLFFRTLSASLLYTVVLLITGSPVYAAAAMPLTSIVFVIIFDRIYVLRFNERLRARFSITAIKSIIHDCWPLAASAIMTMYVLNVEKVLIDRYIPEMQGAWAALFMPAAFINLFSLFVFRPLLTGMTNTWHQGERKIFSHTCLRIVLCILLVCMGVVAIGYLWGIPILERLYVMPLQQYVRILVIILIGGGFNALATFLWHVLILIRKQRHLLIGDIIAFVFSVIIVPNLVKFFAMNGAALGYLLNMLVRATAFSMFVFRFVKGGKQKQNSPL